MLFFCLGKKCRGGGTESPSLCEFCDSEFKRPATGSGPQAGFPPCVGPGAPPACPFRCWDWSPISVLPVYLVPGRKGVFLEGGIYTKGSALCWSKRLLDLSFCKELKGRLLPLLPVIARGAPCALRAPEWVSGGSVSSGAAPAGCAPRQEGVPLRTGACSCGAWQAQNTQGGLAGCSLPTALAPLSPDAPVETLMPGGMAQEGGPLGGDRAMRVEPS